MQRWISPDINFANLSYSVFDNHDSWILDQIEEYNTLNSLAEQKNIRSEWEQEVKKEKRKHSLIYL